MSPEELEAHKNYIDALAKPKMVPKSEAVSSQDFKPKINEYI